MQDIYIDICEQEHKNYRMSYKNYDLNLKSTIVSHNHVTTENCTRLENNDVTTNESYTTGNCTRLDAANQVQTQTACLMTNTCCRVCISMMQPITT